MTLIILHMTLLILRMDGGRITLVILQMTLIILHMTLLILRMDGGRITLVILQITLIILHHDPAHPANGWWTNHPGHPANNPYHPAHDPAHPANGWWTNHHAKYPHEWANHPHPDWW